MKDEVLLEVSDILDSFNIEEMSKLIKSQINSDYENDSSTEILTDHFKPIYVKYKYILDKYPEDSDVRVEAERNFMKVCNVFLQAICKKFDLTLDMEWMESNIPNLPGMAMAMYSFFIIDFSSNVYDVLVNYIGRNTKMLCKAFESLKNKKDASTLVNKKNLSPEMSLIVSNVYDVSNWILEQVDEDTFFKYLSVDYLPFKVVYGLYSKNVISGEFMSVVNDIFRSSTALKSDICFKIVSNTKIGAIRDPYKADSIN